MMNNTLEKNASTLLEEQTRRECEEHNANISDNYKKLMEASVTVEDVSKTETKRFTPLEYYRPVQERKEITFEDVLIPENRMRAQKAASPVTEKPDEASNRQKYAIRERENVLNSPGYVEASRLLEKQSERVSAAFASATTEETLSMPTQTTLQYTKPVAAAQHQTATAVANKADDAVRVYYAQLAQKMAVILAAAFAVMMVVITINSAVINGMDIQIVNLEHTLETLQNTYAELQNSIQEAKDIATFLQYLA